MFRMTLGCRVNAARGGKVVTEREREGDKGRGVVAVVWKGGCSGVVDPRWPRKVGAAVGLEDRVGGTSPSVWPPQRDPPSRLWDEPPEISHVRGCVLPKGLVVRDDQHIDPAASPAVDAAVKHAVGHPLGHLVPERVGSRVTVPPELHPRPQDGRGFGPRHVLPPPRHDRIKVAGPKVGEELLGALAQPVVDVDFRDPERTRGVGCGLEAGAERRADDPVDGVRRCEPPGQRGDGALRRAVGGKWRVVRSDVLVGPGRVQQLGRGDLGVQPRAVPHQHAQPGLRPLPERRSRGGLRVNVQVRRGTRPENSRSALA
eukprot:m.20046 g.20046  ORF g.20046 m.20046 type:complete len:315 (-) comp5521_c0_seq1:509-1453(-)